MNPNTNSAKREDAAKTCDFLNQRFGYRMALEAVLAAHGLDAEVISTMSGLARDRQLEHFNQLLHLHINNRS